ncbi:MAG: hypothetical protein ABR562_01400 [Thermoplasmatota archaeon]|nr:hypothetical protein [Halobacteriales archaeon]
MHLNAALSPFKKTTNYANEARQFRTPLSNIHFPHPRKWRMQKNQAKPLRGNRPNALGTGDHRLQLRASQKERAYEKAIQRLDAYSRRHSARTSGLLGYDLADCRDCSNPFVFLNQFWEMDQPALMCRLGAHMSYQDHGEAGLARRHPHIDLTLNGYRVQDGKVSVVEDEEFHRYSRDFSLGRGEDYARAVEIVETNAQALRLGAKATSIYVGTPLESYARYHKILSYQLREMIDLRKLRYNAEQRLVGWESYKEPYETTWLGIQDWEAAYAEYSWRLKLFESAPMRADGKRKSARILHRSFGHMADGEIGRTQRATRGTPEAHPDNCGCRKCGEWQRVFIEGDLEEWHALATPYEV